MARRSLSGAGLACLASPSQKEDLTGVPPLFRYLSGLSESSEREMDGGRQKRREREREREREGGRERAIAEQGHNELIINMTYVYIMQHSYVRR